MASSEDHTSPTASEGELREALAEGDPERVRSLLDSGANVRFVTQSGYDALLTAVHGRDILVDPRLLDLLRLLIARGANLSGVSKYSESALRVLSRVGRFDAVQVLLDAGADADQLRWTSLMRAVAFGSIDDVRDMLVHDASANLEARDWWERTAWLIAVLAGSIDKAKLLLAHGADASARGKIGRPALFYAIQGRRSDVLRWLLDEELADINQRDKFGTTALMEAVEYGDLDCVDVCLVAGIDVQVDYNGTALSRATSRAMILRLLDAGADPADADQRVILELGEPTTAPLDAISPHDFQRHFTRVFGQANPQVMQAPLWEAMIRAGVSGYGATQRFGDSRGSSEKKNAPVWSAQRFGQTLTLLPDGRAVQVAGEHEDHYDPDFCIYNDVFVFAPDRTTITIYGYPESVFPPTDFHTATLVGDWIYLIGCLGYPHHRHLKTRTPIYRLHVHTFRIEQVEAAGNGPGWIYRHRAAAIGNRHIRIWGGEMLAFKNDPASGRVQESSESNRHAYVLSLESLRWQCEPAKA